MSVNVTTCNGHVGVRELKAHLSSYLQRVAAGEELVVTDRGRPVARLVPLGPGTDTLAELMASGLVSVPRRPKAPAPQPVTGRGAVSDLVAEQRR